MINQLKNIIIKFTTILSTLLLVGVVFANFGGAGNIGVKPQVCTYINYKRRFTKHCKCYSASKCN